ncbi:AAA family ATPase [Mycolicibacterium sp. HK-90]|uniref:AAA family ATPase n=1 Tax=Mycolicibacterium sp. HK-90 TaxID=3056937 RepID=UPI0026593BCA|nr:AAA family ATPase [Mycolicibacterium sp. HK-90]WKG06110.1 AAA family ATPase [Mycolicibacterium sp. HK-90]
MTSATLDIDGRVVNRRRELGELRAAAATAERDGGTCVLASGAPGVGKSTLIQSFGQELAGRNCIFAYGRFRDSAPAPYAAIGDALSELVRSMAAAEPAESDSWRADLSAGTSPLTGILGDLVPELTHALGTSPPVAELDAVETRGRLHRGIIRLLSVTASHRMVLLAVDDLQWADQDSLLLLSELLTVAPRNVLVLGAYRAGEFDESTIGLASPRLRSLHLDPLKLEDVEELLAELGGHSLEMAEVAAEFQHRTGGNPLQIRQLLYRAQREGALIQTGDGKGPGWDLRVLASIEVSTTEAEFLESYLNQLRPAELAVLSSLSCIGAEFDLTDATVASDQPSDVVAQALWSGMELRLVEAVDSGGRRIANAISHDARYRFSHDRVAEAARDNLSGDAQREVHLRMGRHLIELGEDRLFEAARHVGLGALPEVVGLDDAERTRFVELLRRAARKARAQASFPLTLEYSRNALRLLGPQRWDTYFPLTRELQLEAADAALAVGDVTALYALLDEADAALIEPADRARLAYLRLKGHVAQNRLREALEIGLTALDELGEPLPAEVGKPRMANAMIRMRMTMRRWSNDRLLNLPNCTDRRVIELQRILAELRSMSYIVRPNLFPLLVRKQLDLTLTHGHTPSSPLVLASYGLLLVILGDHTGSQRFGEVGLQLAERPEFREARPQTLFMHLNFIHHWCHPLRDGLGLLRDAVTEALDQGDQEYGGFLAATLISQSFWVGRPLAEIDALARTLIPQIRSQRAPSTLCEAQQQMALNLMGRCEDPLLLAGESGYDEREVVAAARREGDEVIMGIAAAMKQGLCFWSGDHAGAIPFTEEVIRHFDGLVGTSVTQLVYLVGALSLIEHAPRDRATGRFVRKALTLHRKCAQNSPENYAAAYELLQGSWARARGHHRQAERHLHRAIALAETHQLPMIGARTHEEAALLYAETGRVTLRDHMLRSAFQHWLNLGVAIRTDWLAQQHPWLLSRDLVHPGSVGIDPVGAHQLIRTLAGARTADGLARIILGSVADTTGAGRVQLLTRAPEDAWMVRAEYDHGAVSILDVRSTETSDSADLVRRVAASGIPQASAHTLASPILMQDRVIGVLCARHEEDDGHFTSDQQEAVTFLCAQAAAPLWNFQLEAQLKAADEYRQSLIDAQSRFVPNELLRILDIDDLRRVRAGYRVEREMTVLISDIRGYTTLLEDMDVSEAGNLAMGFLRAVELPIISCNGFIQDVRGDEIVAVFESPDDAVRAGLAMLRSMREHNRDRLAHGSAELRAGIGINTGPVGVGLVGGVNRMVLTIIGDAVNLAARIESTNKRYGSALLISEATKRRLDPTLQFDVRRMERVMVVNRRKPVTIYEVYDDDSETLRAAKRAAQPAFEDAFSRFDAGDIDGARAAFVRCRQLLPDDPVAPLHLAHCDAIARGELAPGQEVALHQK